MEHAVNQIFKNEYTKRFHDYFYYKLKKKEIDVDEFYSSMGVAEISRYSFFSSMRQGKSSITAEHIRISLEKYGISPDYLFGASETMINAESNKKTKTKDLVGDIKKIKEVLDSLESKILNR